MAQANSAAEIITEENLGNTPSPCPIKKHSSLFYIKSITAFLIGNTVITLGFTTFISPNEFLAAGVYGLAGIFVHYLPQFSFALALFLFSLPPLFWGLKELDKFFVLMTAASVGLQTLLLTLFTGVFSYTNDVLLACLAGGVLSGIGSGIILRGGGASGGMDLLAMILRRKYGISVGTTSMAINITIVALGSLIFGFERGLYTMVVMFVAGKTMNLVVEGISRKRTAFVITKKGDEIGIKLNNVLQRGVTKVPATGVYSGENKDMLFCVVNVFEISRLKEIVRQTDPQAFVTVYETVDVSGAFNKHHLFVDRVDD